MVSTKFEVFDTIIQKSEQFLTDVMNELHRDDPQDAYAGLRATLIALRNRLTIEEAIHVGDQLPLLIRGIYYEGWNPGVNPSGERHLNEFLQNIDKLTGRNTGLDANTTAQGVFAVLARHISAGELEDVRSQLPKELQQLFPS